MHPGLGKSGRTARTAFAVTGLTDRFASSDDVPSRGATSQDFAAATLHTHFRCPTHVVCERVSTYPAAEIWGDRDEHALSADCSFRHRASSQCRGLRAALYRA